MYFKHEYQLTTDNFNEKCFFWLKCRQCIGDTLHTCFLGLKLSKCRSDILGHISQLRNAACTLTGIISLSWNGARGERDTWLTGLSVGRWFGWRRMTGTDRQFRPMGNRLSFTPLK